MWKLSEQAQALVQHLHDSLSSWSWFGKAKREESITNLLVRIGVQGEPAGISIVARCLFSPSHQVRTVASQTIHRLLSLVSPDQLIHLSGVMGWSWGWYISDAYAENLKQPWSQYVDEFMANKVACHPEPTQVAYMMCLNAFTRVATPKILGDITLPLLDEFVAKRMQEDVSPVTVNKELRHLRACLNWLKKRRYMPAVPEFVFLRIDNTQPTTIPEADFVAMIEALKLPGLKLVRRPAEWWRSSFMLPITAAAGAANSWA